MGIYKKACPKQHKKIKGEEIEDKKSGKAI